MIDGFGVGPAFAQNVLRNRLPLDGLSRRNKGVHLFLKPVVQQGIDVLLVIVKRIGAALRTFDQSGHGDPVEGHFGKHFAPPERSGMHPFCVVNTPGGNPPAAIRHKRKQHLIS